MRWILILTLAFMTAAAGYADDELIFPFNRTTRITFIRLGSLKADAGQQFVLKYEKREWTIERRISRTEETIEQISEERAQEILQAFSELYSHWQERPYFNSEASGYSMFISINDVWRMAISVKDRGSPALNNLLEVIQYPEGVTLEAAGGDKVPGGIRAATENAEGSAAATQAP